jgi:prepilin-type N-terminal cleavage/methylation domain-containing protein
MQGNLILTTKTERPVVSGLRPGARRVAFTLVELLVVIAIIGILATLILAVTGHASLEMRLSRVRGELSQIRTAVEAYHAQFGSYPPDHVLTRALNGQALVVNPAINPLFYELTGTVATNAGFVSQQDGEMLPTTRIRAAFGVDGFVNSGDAGRPSKNFLPNWSISDAPLVQTVGGQVRILTIPVPWPANAPNRPLSGTLVNPVYYVSSRPTNNPPGSFDLWATFIVGKQTYTLGNWNDFK